jgi:hypothetical protein
LTRSKSSAHWRFTTHPICAFGHLSLNFDKVGNAWTMSPSELGLMMRIRRCSGMFDGIVRNYNTASQ